MIIRRSCKDATAEVPVPYRIRKVEIQLNDAYIVKVVKFGRDLRGRWVLVEITNLDGETRQRRLRTNDRIVHSIYLTGKV